MSDRINYEFNKKLKATGDKVILEKIEKKRDIIRNGIFIPDEAVAGYTMSKARVISIGPKAQYENFKEGDIVFYDTCSVFYDTHPIVVTKIENIIGICEEEKD